MGDSRKAKDDQVSWAEFLADARQVEVAGPPKGWMSVRDVAVEIGKSEARTQYILNAAWRAGKLERRQFQRWTGVRCYPAYFYNMSKK